MIGIIDMNTNNINCFVKLMKRFTCKYKIIREYNDYNTLEINKLIIPGIGNYKYTMEYIKQKQLDKVIKQHNNNGKQILSVCIGMQILTEYGTESCNEECNEECKNKICYGLNILGNTKTDILECDDILPHIGWNNINIIGYETEKGFCNIDLNNNLFYYVSNMFKNVDIKNVDFYFVHSYVVESKNNYKISDKWIIGKSIYGNKEFIAFICTENILALQFHPEKSGIAGIRIIENFVKS
jgi:imidazoleglycerol phosphate synthase glutamine amidotransferase subunit HisH